MSGSDYSAIFFHSIFPYSSPTSPENSQNRFMPLLRRVLAGGLFFLVLLFAPLRAFPADLTLAWDPNTEANLEGYGVYFKKDAPGPPYDLFGNVALSEFSDPDNPTFTLTGLEIGSRYYITLTAYDSAGNESGYAEPVCAEVGDQILPCGSVDESNGSGSGDASANPGSGGENSGSGGGGGGCFIATALEHANLDGTLFGLFLLAAVIFHFLQKIFTRRNSTTKIWAAAPLQLSNRRKIDAGDR